MHFRQLSSLFWLGAHKSGIFRDHISKYSKLLANRRRISTSSIGPRTSAGVEHRKASPTNAFNERSRLRTNAYNERGQRGFGRSPQKWLLTWLKTHQMATLGGGLLQQPAEPDQCTASIAWGQYKLIWGGHATPSNTQRSHRNLYMIPLNISTVQQ